MLFKSGDDGVTGDKGICPGDQFVAWCVVVGIRRRVIILLRSHPNEPPSHRGPVVACGGDGVVCGGDAGDGRGG
jgi:hypothetical protein